MKPTDKIFCNTFGTHFQMYYKMRILPDRLLEKGTVLRFAQMDILLNLEYLKLKKAYDIMPVGKMK